MNEKKDIDIRYLLNILSEERGRRRDLENKLRSMENSLTWRTLLRFEKALNFILPPGTGRRLAYDRFILSLRKIPSPVIGFSNDLQALHKVNKDWEATKRGLADIYIKYNLQREFAFSTTADYTEFVGHFPAHATPLVSIIVLTFNQVVFTHRCLDSILKHTKNVPYELIVVDNKSTDDTRELLRKLTNVKLIMNNTNLGFVDGCNQAAARAVGKYLLFLNNDTVVTANWLPPLVSAIENMKNCGSVGPKLLSFDGLIQSVGAQLYRDGHCENIGEGERPDHPDYTGLSSVDHCTAACLLVSRALFQDIGGFDLRYRPAYYEDVDLGLEIINRGYYNICEPHSLVYHNRETSGSRMDTTHLLERNRLRLRSKWREYLKAKPEHNHSSSAR